MGIILGVIPVSILTLNERCTTLRTQERQIMNYEEILKCYEGETDIHASTSFEFGLMNELYYQLFYSYPEVDSI